MIFISNKAAQQCPNLTCLNGGTCIYDQDLSMEFCNCLPEFSGLTCETALATTTTTTTTSITTTTSKENL